MYWIEIYRLDLGSNKFTKLDVLTTYFNLSYVNKLDNIGTCQFSLMLDDAKATKVNLERFVNHVVIKRGDDLSTASIVWFGPIIKRRAKGKGSSATIDITASSYLYHLKTRYVLDNLYYSNTDQSTILWNLISYTQLQNNGNLKIIQGTLPSTISRDRTYESGRVISDQLINMSNVINGCSFSFDAVVDASNNLDYILFNTYYPKGSIRNDLPVISFDYNVLDFDYSDDYEIFNYIRVVGQGISDASPYGLNENMDSEVGFLRRELIDSAKDVSIQETLDDHASTLANLYNTNNYNLEITLYNGKKPLFEDLIIGDYLNVNLQRNFINFTGQKRIVAITVEIDNNGEEKIKPQLAIY